MFFKLRYTGILFKKLIYLFLAVLHKRHVEFELMPSAVEARSRNHWTVREAPGILDCTISKGLFFFSHLIRQKSTSLCDVLYSKPLYRLWVLATMHAKPAWHAE